ncbi:hypothetical protein BCV70DRAFT_33554 [Testicularia cyperi]|uniref:Uncharacterized protein n=1 Tax=Testicularia cyperi TaxID=1882483 RepID=A0A317XKX3_9BASI|nr:hypothetical protein BCV70DRAFT_33554 [Testicularia cyperi]
MGLGKPLTASPEPPLTLPTASFRCKTEPINAMPRVRDARMSIVLSHSGPDACKSCVDPTLAASHGPISDALAIPTPPFATELNRSQIARMYAT